MEGTLRAQKLAIVLLIISISALTCNGLSAELEQRLQYAHKQRLLTKRSVSDFRNALKGTKGKRDAPVPVTTENPVFEGLDMKGFENVDFAENSVDTSPLENNEAAESSVAAVPDDLDNDHKEKEHPELGSRQPVWGEQKVTNEQINQQTAFQSVEQLFMDDMGPTLFTVANTDTARPWEQIPYREKFQWSVLDAPCHEFVLAVPDERDAHGEITVCIYRRNLEYTEKSAMIIHQPEKHVETHEQREMKVYGHVVDHPGSAVYGRLVNRYFYGEVSMVDTATKQPLVYVIEEIGLLSSLLHHSEKLIHNLLVVMNKGAVTVSSTNKHRNHKNASRDSTPEKQYNAVVTIGRSILTFVSDSFNPDQFKPIPFVVLSTGHNSYISSGDPIMQIDDNGRVQLASPGDAITIEIDGSVMLKTKSKEYTFRPGGKTILREGLKVTTLQEHEGPVALTAVTSTLNYGCVVPSPAFTDSRKGGLLCKVCIAADKSFHEKYRKTNNDSTTTFLGNVIDKVSWIFRSVDWNNDQTFDNIGLDYDLQIFEWKYIEEEREETTAEELEVLFNTLTSIDFSDCCLGVAFTMKKFPKNIFAKSSSSKPMTPAGICAVRMEEVSNNVILISGNDKKGGYSAMSNDQLVYLTAHEIAKAFGATADTTGESNCDSFTDSNGNTRHFLLWPDVLRETTLEEKHFSPCSQQSIQKALATCKSSCFDLDPHPFCGNGIVEEGEECDCGSELACKDQFCCFGRSGKYPCHKTGVPCKKRSGGIMTSSSALLVLLAAMITPLARIC